MTEQEIVQNKANNFVKTNFNKKDYEIYKRKVFLPVKNNDDVNRKSSMMDIDVCTLSYKPRFWI